MSPALVHRASSTPPAAAQLASSAPPAPARVASPLTDVAPGRRAHVLVALAACALLCAFATPARAQGVEPVAFHLPELLFYPRPDGVTLSLMPEEQVALRVDYGPAGVPFDRSTPVKRVRDGQRATFDLGGLSPDGSWSYRVSVRRPGETAWTPRDTHTFRTLRSPGSEFTFAVAADTHAWSAWAAKSCGGINASWGYLKAAMESLRDDPELDFVVNGTDHALTVCGSGGCNACPVDGQPTTSGSVGSALDALLRYRKVFSGAVFGRFGKHLPQLVMLGDHEGERGWSDPAGTVCGFAQEHLQWSRWARHRSLPDPPPHADGSPADSYFALRSGDVLLVALDVTSFTQVQPVGPESWTLGERQLAWFEDTLRHSDATFKIVMAEHLLGGISKPDGNCFKGRGGLRSTHNGEVWGDFLGEQYLVHELMKAYGAQVFLSFHDHVAVFGEKLDAQLLPEGVTYVTGGRASLAGNGWINQGWYAEAMDYDGDGVPEYQTDVTGSTKAGYFKIRVVGDERLDFAYVRADPDPDVNGEVVLEFSVTP